MSATMPMRSATSVATDAISYEDLYARWEKGNWRATELDFTQDRTDWHETFGDIERRAALWNYALFFHGEDSVATNLTPYIDAAPLEEQKYFLTTQQVDEARHAVFFKRFMDEVVEVGGDGSTAGTLAATEPELTWGFRKTFERLDQIAEELRHDRSRPKLAQAVTLYHIIVEASLAQPGQHFIESYLTDRKLLPGFQEGMRNVSLDEQRHIGFGVKLLSDLIREDRECVDAIVEMINEIIPVTTAVLLPPNWDRSYTECFGFTLEDIYAEGATSMESKLRAMGMPAEAMDRITLPFDLPARERGERGIKLLQANMLGEKVGPPSRDPEAIRILFDSVRRSVDPRVVPPGTTIQWDFDDAEPWYLHVDNGSTRMEQGRAGQPDLTLRSSFEDFVDIAAGREDPRRQLLRRRLRPSGKLRMLVKLPKLFG
jgi:ribonucleotide reductase beta subunit family protein with ferritin-like domain